MIDWSYWANLAVVDYKDACTLSRGFEPRTVNAAVLPPELAAEIQRRQAIAADHLGGSLPAHSTRSDRYYERDASGVRLTEFRAWAESLPTPFTFPDTFPRATAPAQDAQSHAPARWPWGDHETELLRKLAAAAEKWWKNYDPTDATTAPTNKSVADWLKEQGIADRNAQVMATILRADNLPTGPRK